MFKKYKYAWYLSGFLMLFFITINVGIFRDEIKKGPFIKDSTTVSTFALTEKVARDTEESLHIQLSSEKGKVIMNIYDDEKIKHSLALLPIKENVEDYEENEYRTSLPKSILDMERVIENDANCMAFTFHRRQGFML